MSVVDDSFDHPMKLEERASAPLAGGIMMHGYQCGMLWGATLAAGAQAYRIYGPGPLAETEAITVAHKLTESFRARNKDINCFEITEMDLRSASDRPVLRQVFKFLIRGGPIACFRMAARYAPVAFSEIDTAFSEQPIKAPSAPTSCAAMLAKKMGVSEQHATMSAGFAGGIGLSGGACGALGAAIWINGLNQSVEIEGFSYSGTWVENTIEKFLESSDYELECTAIVCRKFEDVGDHAEYIHTGGCVNIMEALAEK